MSNEATYSAVEMNFCRRCGAQLRTTTLPVAFMCENGHAIYNMMPTGANAFIFNTKGELLVVRRAIEPGKGMLDIPGGFSVLGETLEETAMREIAEEVGIQPAQYSRLSYMASGIDTYPYKGETFQVLVTMFRANLIEEVMPEAHDDAASYEFIALEEIALDDFFSTALKAAFPFIGDGPA